MRRLPDGYSEAVVVARGGTATVYRANEDAHDRAVAIKVINAVDDAVARRFERERRAMGRLSTTPGIASIYSSGITEDGEPYIVMPYLSGGTLLSLVKAGPQPEPKVTELMVSVSRALSIAHEMDTLHLDVKPSNILLDDSGSPFIADFGIAEVVGQTGEMSGSLMTPSYAPPERIDGAPPDISSDVYGVGAVLFALLAGEAPFSGSRYPTASATLRGIVEDEPDLSLLHDTSEPMADLIGRCLAKDPSRRPATAAAVHAELVQLAAAPTEAIAPGDDDPDATRPFAAPRPDDETIVVPATTTVGPAQAAGESPGGRRTGRRAALIAAALLVAAAGVILAVLLWDRDTDDTPVAADQAGATTVAPSRTSTSSPTSAPEVDTPRQAELFAGFARLRAAPQLDAPVVADVGGTEGSEMEVLQPIEDGWYRVDIDGSVGWIFGAFVLPPDEGYAVAQSADNRSVLLRDADGEELETTNPSGNKVLITRIGTPLHDVLLPDGTSARVLGTDVIIVGN
ncbi:MAG: serine/threonine protein kinase [Acidimicrobiales bacterium]